MPGEFNENSEDKKEQGIEAILQEIVGANREIENIEEMNKVMLTVDGNTAEVTPLDIDASHLELCWGEVVFSVELERIQRVERMVKAEVNPPIPESPKGVVLSGEELAGMREEDEKYVEDGIKEAKQELEKIFDNQKGEELVEESGKSIETTPEMSPEDFAEMIDQIPALKEMLQERKDELENLSKKKRKTKKDKNRIQELSVEIEELSSEIEGREDMIEE